MLFRSAPILVTNSQALAVNPSGRVEHLCKRQAALGANDNSVRLKSRFLSKLSGDVFNALNSDLSGHALIALLFLATCPAAVLRAIALAVVYAFKRVAIWARAHISQEIVESISVQRPTLANVNTSAPVVLPLSEFWVGTAINNASPNVVQRMRISERHVFSLTHAAF